MSSVLPNNCQEIIFHNDGWVWEFAIIAWTWQILYFLDCNNNLIENSTKRAWNWTRESIDSVANEAADDTLNHM